MKILFSKKRERIIRYYLCMRYKKRKNVSTSTLIRMAANEIVGLEAKREVEKAEEEIEKL